MNRDEGYAKRVFVARRREREREGGRGRGKQQGVVSGIQKCL